MAIKKGIYAASMSIFKEDLSLDIDSTIKHSEKLIGEGLHGAIFFGSTGCAQLISSNEKKQLIDRLNNSKFKNKVSKEFLDNYIVKEIPFRMWFPEDYKVSNIKELSRKLTDVSNIINIIEYLLLIL